MNREDVEFRAGDVTLRGWLYHPEEADGPSPVVVMAHGIAAVKEQHLGRFAEVFAEAGLAALVYDHRNFGASDGEPRNDVDPWAQVADYRHAISYARSRGDLDPGSVGVWGTSFSGGHALVVAATDPRVRCVAVQVPTISGFESFRRRVSPDRIAAVEGALVEDRERIFAGKPPAVRPVIPDGSETPALFASPDAVEFLSRPDSSPPEWENAMTLRSTERARDYEPGIYVDRISPAPLLMVVADDDTVTLTDLALRAYREALEPKKLVMVPGPHWAPYEDAFEAASAAARDWFVEHLAH
jgi:fermentation-respiration switch protein FrsA (DUF1100 family)